MHKKKNIENAVCEYFKVNISDVYKARKSKYPYNGAKIILMYLLFANGYKSYDIAEWFGFTTTMVYRHCGDVQVALKNETKVKEDLEKIQEIFKRKIKMTFEKAIELAKKRVGDTYKYVSLERIKNHDYITFICPEHGEQKQRLDGHFKHGCPWCARMKSNRKNYPLAYGYGINDVANVWNTCRKAFFVWRSMLSRCYDPKYQAKEPSYVGCIVCDEWLKFSNFLKWFEDNYTDGYQLDKDIIHKGNKVYAPEHCAFVPREINSLILRKQAARGDTPIGVKYDKRRGYYSANVQYDGRSHFLGYAKNAEEAFLLYKESKEKRIKEMAESYRDVIDVRVYTALKNYKVEITD